MIVYPIIPIWIMGLICIGLITLIVVKGRKKWGLLRQILIVILLFCINIRIMIKSPNAQVASNNLDVLFVIDNTLSMLAEDYNGNNRRIDAVRSDCKYIMDELAGARFSIITFNNSAQVLVPYTRDINIANESLEILKTMDTFYARGTSLSQAKNAALKSLKDISGNSDKNRIIFFISDGEITNGDDLESFSSIKKYVGNGAVLGYGTKKGGKMLVTDHYDDKEHYLQDKSNYPYVDAISKIDEDNLEQIAEDIGIDYINMSRQSNIKSKLEDIKKGVLNSISNENKSSYTDTYYFFVIPLIILLMYELIIYKRRF